jgi:hypothetical protein
MSIHVICSGCLKRFRVGVRFAGMQGPCPSCGAIISIPQESVKIHEDDVAETKQRRKQRVSTRPIPRLDLEFDPIQVKRYALAVLGVLLLTFLIGCLPMYAIFRSLLGILGLCLVAFPLVLFGYQVLRDREQMLAFTGEILYRRAGFVAAGYVILWLGFEWFLVAAQADVFISWIYFAAFALLATLLVHPLLEMKTPDAFLHYCIFGFSVVFLRFLIGFGWFWASSELFRNSTAPPPPLLLGM